MPKISVIVPVYNVESYLKRCVDSILGQTYSDFELILVDDGSPDNCPQICNEYAEKDSRIRVIHQLNGGLSAARNAGIDWVFQNSDSEWFSFIDSDDYVHPRYLEVLLNAAESTGCDVSIGSYIEFSGDSVKSENEIAVPKKYKPEDFYVQYSVETTIACGKLYRRRYFETIRYPVGKIHEDEFTTYKILFQNEN
ncbi:MAG: glycosyltransferase family 2 protein, partial [Spirochaetales bacterium]|nr:glycosyltransferase family 2 protein [Spirochaetales bacterium]